MRMRSLMLMLLYQASTQLQMSINAVCFRRCRIFDRMGVTEFVLDKVVLHPLVLLSLADHFSRMGKIGNQKRVVGLLLGSWSSKGLLDIAYSFAIPFDEDDKVRL